MRGRYQGAPARVVDRTDPRRGLFGPPHVRVPSVSELPAVVARTAHDVRGAGGRRPRRCGARLGALTGGAEALPRDARTCGGPNRRAERLRPPVGVGALGDAGRGFRVQHSLNVPALVGYQLVVMCASFPRSVPRAAAPGGPPEGTPPTL